MSSSLGKHIAERVPNIPSMSNCRLAIRGTNRVVGKCPMHDGKEDKDIYTMHGNWELTGENGCMMCNSNYFKNNLENNKAYKDAHKALAVQHEVDLRDKICECISPPENPLLMKPGTAPDAGDAGPSGDSGSSGGNTRGQGGDENSG